MPDETQEPKGQAAAPAEKTPEQAEVKHVLGPDSVRVEDVGTLKKKVTVKVSADQIQAKRQEMFGELAHTAQVPGFRVGHAPQRLIEKRFGREVSHDVRNALVGQTLGEAIEQADLKVLGEPELDVDKIEMPKDGDLEYSFEVEVAPEFQLPELKGIKVQKPLTEVTEQRVDEQLDRWRQMQARYEAADQPAGEGDAVTVDVRIGGEGVDPVHHKDINLRVAPGQVEGLPLVELGKVLAGKKAGEPVSLTVKVPEAHPNESWRGKDATVELTVTQVRRRILPDLTEESAKVWGFETLAALREQIRKNMAAAAANETQRALRDQVSQYLLDSTAFDLPAGVAARHTARVLQRRYVDLLSRGVPRERIDENLAELQAEATEQAQRDLKLTFVLGRIAEQEKLEVSEDEVNARIAEMAKQYNRRPERLRQELASEGTLAQVEETLREEKALDKLLTSAEVSEAVPSSQAPAETQTEAKPKAKPRKRAAEKVEGKPEQTAKAKPKAADKAQAAAPSAGKKKADKPKPKRPGGQKKGDAQ